MDWTTYVAIALVGMMGDAITCHASKRRYRLLPNLIFAAIWPITFPVVVIGAAWLTRNHPPVASTTQPEGGE